MLSFARKTEVTVVYRVYALLLNVSCTNFASHLLGFVLVPLEIMRDQGG